MAKFVSKAALPVARVSAYASRVPDRQSAPGPDCPPTHAVGLFTISALRAIARGSGAELSETWLPRRIRSTRVLEALPLAAAVFTTVGFVVAAYFRITFAYPMWVMETPAMQAIRRIVEGQPLYAQPTLDYVAPIYAPLFFYLSALVTHVVGVNLAAPRLVSLVASLGAAVLVGYLVWGETRRMLLALVGAGLFISTTTLSSLSLDLARVDPLCLFLLLAAIATARAAQRQHAQTARAVWLNLASGVLTGLAILTKQTAFTMALPLLVVAVLDRRWRSALAYLIGVVATTSLGALLLYAQVGSWVEYFLVRLPRQHSLSLDQVGVFWSQKLLPERASSCCSPACSSSAAACAATTVSCASGCWSAWVCLDSPGAPR